MKRTLVSQLQDIAREDAAARLGDAPWLRRAGGHMTNEEERALLADAKEGEAQLLARTTAPWSAEREEKLLDLLTGGASASGAPAPASRLAPPSRLRARVVFLWAGPTLAAAAGLALWLRVQPANVAPMVAYDLVVEGVDAEQRGSPAPAPGVRYRPVSPGARLRIVLRPGREAPLDHASASVVSGGETRTLPAPRISPSGTVTLEGTREVLFGASRGEVDLLIDAGGQRFVVRLDLR